MRSHNVNRFGVIWQCFNILDAFGDMWVRSKEWIDRIIWKGISHPVQKIKKIFFAVIGFP